MTPNVYDISETSKSLSVRGRSLKKSIEWKIFVRTSVSVNVFNTLIGGTFQARIGIWKCWFLGRGENHTRRKTSRTREENQQQTQPTYDARSGNRTWDTLVGGERSHHCAIPALQNGDFNQVSVWLRHNGLINNHKKSEAMLVGSRYSVANTRDLQVKLDGKLLKQSEHCKYLGVYMDS